MRDWAAEHGRRSAVRVCHRPPEKTLLSGGFLRVRGRPILRPEARNGSEIDGATRSARWTVGRALFDHHRMSEERIRALRGATYRRDDRAVVELLSDRPLDPDRLQLAGDGIRAAVAAGEPGADQLASDCAEALRRRGWSGDDLLADHLDALVGRGPAALLRPLAVSLDELSEILEGDPLNGGGRIDRHTGEVWYRAQIDYAVEMGEEDPDEGDSDRWLWVQCVGSRDGYRDMEDFIANMTDSHQAELLAVAIEGRGAFRRFKDVLHRWPDLVERWYGFSDDRRTGRAREWLADAGYRPADAR